MRPNEDLVPALCHCGVECHWVKLDKDWVMVANDDGETERDESGWPILGDRQIHAHPKAA